MLDTLFTFPIIMVDSDNEEKKEKDKEKMALESDLEADIVIGNVECPYWDFISISDKWLPNKESFENALKGKFDACGVLFSQSGHYLVPWTREKFKKEFKKFVDKQPKHQLREVKIVPLENDEDNEIQE